MKVEHGHNYVLGIGGIFENKDEYTIRGRVIAITPLTTRLRVINITGWVIELAIVPMYGHGVIKDKTKTVHIRYLESLNFVVNNYINIHNATKLDNLYLAKIGNTIIITSSPVLPF